MRMEMCIHGCVLRQQQNCCQNVVGLLPMRSIRSFNTPTRIVPLFLNLNICINRSFTLNHLRAALNVVDVQQVVSRRIRSSLPARAASQFIAMYQPLSQASMNPETASEYNAPVPPVSETSLVPENQTPLTAPLLSPPPIYEQRTPNLENHPGPAQYPGVQYAAVVSHRMHAVSV